MDDSVHRLFGSPSTLAVLLARSYRAQSRGLQVSENDLHDYVVRGLTRQHGVSVATAIKLASDAIKTSEAWGTIEEDPLYRADWPYTFKWSFNNRTGEPHVWRVNAGGDGKPTHKTMYEQQGWSPKEDGLVMGQGIYKPAQRKLDGTEVEPAEVRILYYAHTGTFVPEPIIAWFTRTFPDAFVHCLEFSPGAMWR